VIPTWTSRPPRLPDETAVFNTLTALSESADQLELNTHPAAVQTFLRNPDTDPQRDLQLWHDQQGRPAAAALLRMKRRTAVVEGRLCLRLLPHLRGTALETAVINWAIIRIRQVLVAGQRGRLELIVNQRDDRRLRLAARGFSVVREFAHVLRPLADPIAAPVLPAGYRIRPVDPQQDVAAWTAVYNRVFAEHWNFSPLSVEKLRFLWSDPMFDPQLELVVAAADGAFVGFCTGEYLDRERRSAWFHILGVERAVRRYGLASSLITAGMAVMQAAGARTARLIYDVANANRSDALFQALGFREVQRTVRMWLTVE
jgi:mycothiol synthase